MKNEDIVSKCTHFNQWWPRVRQLPCQERGYSHQKPFNLVVWIITNPGLTKTWAVSKEALIQMLIVIHHPHYYWSGALDLWGCQLSPLNPDREFDWGIPRLQIRLPLGLKELLSWFNFLLYLLGLGDCCCRGKVGKGDLDTEGGES